MASISGEWADRKNVRILHGDNPGAEEVVVNLKKIQDGKATDPVLTQPQYLDFVPPAARVRGYNYSVSYAWAMRRDPGLP